MFDGINNNNDGYSRFVLIPPVIKTDLVVILLDKSLLGQITKLTSTQYIYINNK